MKTDNIVNDEYTDDYLNAQYYTRPQRMGSKSEGCKAYVRSGYARLTKAKYKDANYME